LEIIKIYARFYFKRFIKIQVLSLNRRIAFFMKKRMNFILLLLFLYIMFKKSSYGNGILILTGIITVLVYFFLLKNMFSRLTKKQSRKDYEKEMEEYEEYLEYKRRYKR